MGNAQSTTSEETAPLAEAAAAAIYEQSKSVEQNQNEEVIFDVDSPPEASLQEKPRETNIDLQKTLMHRASVREMVEQKQHLVLSFEHLTSYIPGVNRRCNFGSFSRLAQEYLGTTITNLEPFYAMDNVSGYVETGEMVLVLSPNQHSSSILLRALSGRLQDAELSGNITINGLSLSNHAHQLQGWRRKMPHVSASDATHAAVLTVRETLEFAAQCCSGRDDPDYIQEKVDTTLKALDLTHVAETVVGDENLRGISGGQKRRVTVGEMVLSEAASFLALEGITDGLSSQDSLHLIQQLQLTCNVYRIGAIVSLLQPSDEIVQLFDKVLILSEAGELNYFGPPDLQQLQQVFEFGDGKKNQSIADLVLNPLLNTEVARGHVKRRYMKSQARSDLMERINEARWNAPPASEMNEKIKAILPDTKYACTWQKQFKYISLRRIKMISRNAVTYSRVAIACLFGLIIGSLFGELGTGPLAAMSRTGYLFLNCFLVLMLSAAITIPFSFRERVTLFKHRTAEFYSGRVAYITQVLVDLPLSILEAVLLGSTSYYWVDMKSGANHFTYFLGILVGLEFVGQALGRLLCSVSRKQIFANILSSVVILIFGTVAGFMPAYDSIPVILQWLSWVTPASYAFEGLMLNEFSNQVYSLGGLSTGDDSTQLLTFTGEGWLSGFANLPRMDRWGEQGIRMFDLGMLFFFSLMFDIIGCHYTEKWRSIYFNTSRVRQESTKKAKRETTGNKDDAVDETTSDWPSALTIRNINYFVRLKGKGHPLRFSIHSLIDPVLVAICGKKFGDQSQHHEDKKDDKKRSELQLLNNVNARFARGRMCALMGTSGAGKSTLLDVIAGYKTGGRIEGDVLLDGYPKESKVWKRITGYSEQNDIFNPYLSVIETLEFTAACQLKKSERESIVWKVIQMMELEDYADMIIGREADGEGLPKHARKRLTIATQLVTQPKVLFCDEPTTGLGTTAAGIVMRALRRVTDQFNMITIVTIHQPSKPIWDKFDDLMLLVKGGQVAYFGPMGEESDLVMSYFSKLPGASSRASSNASVSNPADYVLQVVGGMDPSQVVDAYKESSVQEEVVKEIENDVSSGLKGSSGKDAHTQIRQEIRRNKNFFKEFALLTKRQFWTVWRNPSYAIMRMLASFFVSLYMGILFIGDKSEIDGAVFSLGALFFLVFILVIPMQASVVHLIEDRAVLYRESTSGLYSKLAYGLGQLAADIPFHIINTLIMFIMFYYTVGFQREPELIGYFLLMVFLANWSIMSLGQFYALASPNEESANGLAGLSVILSVIFMGFLITVTAMPSYWEWAYWANLIHYLIQGLTTNELANNSYSIFLPESILPSSSRLAVFFPEENATSVTSSNVPEQLTNFARLAVDASPGTNYDWNNSGIVGIGRLVQCWVEHDCLVDPVVDNIINCTIFWPTWPPQSPVCRDDFQFALEVTNVTAVFECLAPLRDENDEMDATSLSFEEVISPLDGITPEENEERDRGQDLKVILCLLNVLLPEGLLEDIIRSVLEPIFKFLFGLVGVIVEIIENGIQLPGEVILLVFGWAEFQEGEGLVAPWKWWYCMFSVGMFIAGLEVLKLFSLQFIVWTKR